MDSLIETLRTFNISKDIDEFESNLNNIIKKLNKKIIDDSNEEWEIIKENYSKLKYLNNLIKEIVTSVKIDNFDLYTNETFNLIILKFMEKVDIQNIKYLNDIDWEDAVKRVSCSKKIEELLRKSVNISNPYGKMMYCREAYNLFIPVIENFRGEWHSYDKVNDTQFIKEFESFKRKRNG